MSFRLNGRHRWFSPPVRMGPRTPRGDTPSARHLRQGDEGAILAARQQVRRRRLRRQLESVPGRPQRQRDPTVLCNTSPSCVSYLTIVIRPLCSRRCSATTRASATSCSSARAACWPPPATVPRARTCASGTRYCRTARRWWWRSRATTRARAVWCSRPSTRCWYRPARRVTCVWSTCGPCRYGTSSRRTRVPSSASPLIRTRITSPPVRRMVISRWGVWWLGKAI